jgi:predicted phosphodiesterase
MDPDEAMNHLSALSEISEIEKAQRSGSNLIPNFALSFQSVKSKVQQLLSGKKKSSFSVDREPLGIKIVMISDTHADHRSLTIPDGDILIHAGDWTCFGHREHATDFNDWLGTLPHPYKIVVNGNHENNSIWKHETPTILSNAIFLCQSSARLSIREKEVTIFGTDFFWPTAHCPHPFLSSIPPDVDILLCHGPPYGLADGGKGCEYLQKKCLALAYGAEAVKGVEGIEEVISRAGGPVGADGGSLRLVVSGHIHYAYGVDTSHPGLTVVNASSCGGARKVVHDPIVLEI